MTYWDSLKNITFKVKNCCDFFGSTVGVNFVTFQSNIQSHYSVVHFCVSDKQLKFLPQTKSHQNSVFLDRRACFLENHSNENCQIFCCSVKVSHNISQLHLSLSLSLSLNSYFATLFFNTISVNYIFIFCIFSLTLS